MTTATPTDTSSPAAETATEAAGAEEAAGDDFTWLWILLGVIAAVLIGVGIYFAVSNNDSAAQ